MSEKSYLFDYTKRITCPVCHHCFFREYDLILTISDEADRRNIYICESEFYDEFPCGFNFLEGLSQKEFEEMAKEKIRSLMEQVLGEAL